MEFERVSDKELKEDLTGFILPFVNAAPDEAVKLFIGFFASEAHIEKEKAEYLAAFGEHLPDNSEQIKHIRHTAKNLKERTKEIKELQKVLRTMLIVAIRGKAGQSIADIPANEIADIEARINRVFARKRPVAKWRGAEGMYIAYRPDSYDHDWLGIYSAGWIHCVVKSFDLRPGFDDKPERLGPGYDMVGLCPICGLFFQRRRSTKEYCSEKCASVARMRAFRDRKK